VVRSVVLPFRVDRERFLILVTAIASFGCTDGRVGRERVEPIEPIEPIEPVRPVPATHVVPDLEPRAVDSRADEPVVPMEEAPTCSNDVGEVDCSRIAEHDVGGPACEGLTGACQLLAQGYAYKPRVAQAIAACWEGLGRAACDTVRRGHCNQAAVREACPDPRFEPECRAILDRCEAAGARIELTMDSCVQALSSIGDDAERSWVAGAMGPDHEGGRTRRCRILVPVW
jgi:hypothetical protein